jgi:hypothetical protein
MNFTGRLSLMYIQCTTYPAASGAQTTLDTASLVPSDVDTNTEGPESNESAPTLASNPSAVTTTSTLAANGHHSSTGRINLTGTESNLESGEETSTIIIPFARLRHLEAGESLFCVGDTGSNTFFVLAAGCLSALKREDDGALQVVAEITPGCVVGGMSFFGRSSRGETIRAAQGGCDVLEVDQEAYAALYRDRPEVLLKIVRAVARQVIDSLLGSDLTLSLSFPSITCVIVLLFRLPSLLPCVSNLMTLGCRS